MRKYPIKLFEKDFKIIETMITTKGSRTKKIVIDSHGQNAFFKYEGNNYNVSEACSEKMSYEIAKTLGYACAKIELARDGNGVLGILNYFFVDVNNPNHMDAVGYLNIHNDERNKFYTIFNIKGTLDSLDSDLFNQFIRIMIFDALVGEQDRHEENWGIENLNGKYVLSPLYDNGCNLLREFKNELFAEKYYSGIKDFDKFINKSTTLIYKEDNKTKYKHFELIEYLNKLYPVVVQKELENLKKLTDRKIENIVSNIPDNLLTMLNHWFQATCFST